MYIMLYSFICKTALMFIEKKAPLSHNSIPPLPLENETIQASFI